MERNTVQTYFNLPVKENVKAPILSKAKSAIIFIDDGVDMSGGNEAQITPIA